MMAGGALTRRLRLLVLLAAGSSVALGACSGAGGDTETPPPEPSTPAPTTFASPPDGVEPRVAESGFSLSPHEPDPSAELLSYGVVVENPSEFVALDVFVRVALLDADGRSVDAISGEPAADPDPQPVTRLLPGERMGLGRTVPHHGSGVAELAVEIEVGRWSPVRQDHWWFHPITAGEVTTRDSADGSVLGFTVDAGYSADMVRGQLWVGGHFTAIFRDSAGAVVGGADCCHAEPQTQARVPPGRSEAELRLGSALPAQADPALTEVYLPDPRENLPS